MQIYSAKTKSVPFPKEGFQKWDIITPKDFEYYGEIKYIVTDYERWEYDTGEVKYYYHIESSIFGCKYETDLNGYEKLYSKRKEIALKIRNNLKIDIKSLLENKKDVYESLGIDTTMLTEGIERIEAFLKVLEHTK